MHNSNSTEKSFVSNSGLLPDIRYFAEYSGLTNNISTEFTVNSHKIFLPIEKQHNSAVIHPRSFASDLYIENSDFAVSDPFKNILSELVGYLKHINIPELIVKPIPDYIFPTYATLFESFKKEFILTSVIHSDYFQLSNRRFRQLKNAKKEGYKVTKCSGEDIDKTWNLISGFLNSRGLFALPINRIRFLLKTYPAIFSLFQVVDNSQTIIGACLVQDIGRCRRIPNYFALKEFPGAIDLLLNEVIESAFSQKISMVDLGISSDPKTEMEIQGIVQFKSEFSAERLKINRYILKF